MRRLHFIARLRDGLRRRAWRQAAHHYTLHASTGWWLTHDIIDPSGTRSTLRALVEPEEIPGILRMLERNGTEEGRSAKIEWGIGQTAREAAKSAKAVKG